MLLEIINNFHFTRPEWFALLIPIIFVFLVLRSQNQKQTAWQKVISPHLLKFLMVSNQTGKVRSGILLAFSIAILSTIAISGPSFREKTVPVFESDSAQVILLDLSLSMDATDIKPSRLERAKFKLLDLLAATNEGTLGLVVYAGDAFVISPLTSDAKTVANMVPTLSTTIMPVLGSRPDLGMAKAIDLLANAKHNNGQIVWLTDGVDFKHADAIIQAVNSSGYELSILAIGTAQGAPIPLPNKNGFLKDTNGAIVVPKLQIEQLVNIADKTQAGIVELTPDSKDLDYLKQRFQAALNAQVNAEQSEQKVSRWIDDGYWLIVLVMLLLLIHLLRFSSQTILRSVVVYALAFGFAFFPNKQALALDWKDLWLTQQQQANQAFQQGQYDRAAQLFKDKNWKGASLYKSGDYAQAAELFSGEPATQAHSKNIDKLDGAPSEQTQSKEIVEPQVTDNFNLPQYESSVQQYNHATALAKANQLEAALDIYSHLLEQQPDHQDALYNKKIIEDLLKQQQKQQEQQNQEQNQDQQDQNQQDQQDQKDQQDEQQSDQEQQQSEQEQEQQTEAERQQQQKEMEISEDQRDKSEKDQALEHWLEKIPDDPGGLLRRKMYREYQRRGREQKEEKLW